MIEKPKKQLFNPQLSFKKFSLEGHSPALLTNKFFYFFVTSEFQKAEIPIPCCFLAKTKRRGQDRHKFRCDPCACFASQNNRARREDSTRAQASAYLAGLFCLPLIVFFILAAFYLPFFIPLIIALVTILAVLIYLYFQLEQKKADAQLRIQDIVEANNLIEEGIKTEQAVIDSFRKKIINYTELKGLTESLSRCLSLDDTSQKICAELSRYFVSEQITTILYLFHARGAELGICCSCRGQTQVNIKAKKGDLFDQWVIRTLQPLFIEDTKSDYRFDMDKIAVEDGRAIRSLMNVPLKVGHKILGLLRLDHPEAHHFTMEDLRLLTTIGDLAAVAVENAQLYERVEQLAIKDGLTGLYLKRYLLDRMSEEIVRQLRHKTQLSFLMIDLDKFKEYNDRFGHMAGDIVLRSIGGLLTSVFNNPGDLICRYGGEEFCVLLPDCSKTKALELAEQLKIRIEKQAIFLRRQKTYVTISGGVAAFLKDAQSREELIYKADQALYKAKQEGRNRVCAA